MAHVLEQVPNQRVVMLEVRSRTACEEMAVSDILPNSFQVAVVGFFCWIFSLNFSADFLD